MGDARGSQRFCFSAEERDGHLGGSPSATWDWSWVQVGTSYPGACWPLGFSVFLEGGMMRKKQLWCWVETFSVMR